MSSFTALFFGNKKVRVGVGVLNEDLPAGAIEFDASISEQHEGDAEITQFPVEVGADISDHIRPQPERITINGIISNSPLQLGADLSLSPTRAEEGYKLLRKMKNSGELVDIVTSLREYKSMGIEGLSVSRDVTTGNVVNATVSLKEVLTAESKEAPAPAPGQTSGAGPTNTGEQKTGAASQGATNQANNSFLRAVGQAITR